jgi:uncharacterized protein YfaS (alpha-2-macroglobulin family)
MSSPTWSSFARLAAVVAVLLFVGLGKVALQGAAPRPSQGTPLILAPTQEEAAVTSRPEETGLRFTLSPATPEAATPRPEPTPAQPIDEQAAQQVLSRLPKLEAASDDQKPFAFPPKSPPAPRPGRKVEDSFPPQAPQQPVADPAKAPLEVLAYAPQGNLAIAPELTVTFSQPMVPLATVSDLAAQDVPIKFTPAVAGSWRWLGTRTVKFVPEPRFPMATRFEVEIPAGIKSVDGTALAQAVRWSFVTPPPKFVQMGPQGGAQPLDPLMWITFDQRIDPAAILARLDVRQQGDDAPRKLRMASPEEVAKDTAAKYPLEQAGKDRWLAFRSEEPFRTERTVVVKLPAGGPSAEGPLKTDAPQQFEFATYGPLKVVDTNRRGKEKLPPLASWTIHFSNPLDEKSLTSEFGQILPEIPGGVRLQLYGNTLEIQGRTSGRTNYTVSLSPEITDIYGQKLGLTPELKFDTGSAEPALISNQRQFITLDPAGLTRLPVYTINQPALKVQLFAVTPAEWPAFVRLIQRVQRGERKPGSPPGRRVINHTLEFDSNADELTEVSIDLAPALKNGLGHCVAVIEATATREKQPPQKVMTWVQSTRLAVDAISDSQRLVAWGTNLLSGKPSAGATVTLEPAHKVAQTDDTGIARFELPNANSEQSAYLTIQQGDDVALLPQSPYAWWSGDMWRAQALADQTRWYVIDDRQMYRPGEELHIKGWVRRIVAGPTGDIAAVGGEGLATRYRLIDPRGNELATGTQPIGKLGGFDLTLKLPQEINLGQATLQFDLEHAAPIGLSSFAHTFQVQEFRRPEFEVTARASDGPHLVGDHADVTVAAKYYAGGALPGAPVNWNITSTPGHFTPPGRDDFTFGRWVPWWIGGGFDEAPSFRRAGRFGRGGGETVTFSGVTDNSGEHRLRIDFQSVEPPRPMQVAAQAQVIDVNRQQWAASTDLLVHPANLYVGLRAERTFVEAGKPLILEAIVCDLDGRLIPERKITIKSVRIDWEFRNSRSREVEVDPREQTVPSTDKPVRLEIPTGAGGSYRITATILDDRERKNQTEMQLWVAGGKVPPNRDLELQQVTLIPDRKEYQPDQTAEILIQSPFAPAEGLVTLRRSGLVETQRVTLTDSSYTLKIPIRDEYIPNIHVQVDLVGGVPRTGEDGKVLSDAPQRPAYASGQLDLAIPPLRRTLAVSVEPKAPAIEPGAKTSVTAIVKDAAGQPLPDAEVCLIAVDEAILALTNYQLTNPLDIFYALRGTDVHDVRLRESVLLANIFPEGVAANEPVAQRMQLRGMGGAFAPEAAPAAMDAAEGAHFSARMAKSGAGGEAAPIMLRQNLNPLAAFVPAAITDANGRVELPFQLPDNLTRYRIMVVAVGGDRFFGKGESTITARLPLMVRPSAPRFLNYGDQFELPVVIQNQTDAPLEVQVAARATNAKLTAGDGRKLTVPPHDRVEVRFPMQADQPGRARFQVAATAGEFSDAAQFDLPVYTPATTEAFATYGQIDEGAVAQTLLVPTDVIPQFGGLDVGTSSTAVSALTDAVLYLVSYPFECAEQIGSRVLAIAALRDVLTAFQAEGLPPADEIQKSVVADLERLQKLQQDDGGFAFWTNRERPWPYLSIHVAHALARAKQKDFPVPQEMLDKSLSYLRNIDANIPADYPDSCRWSLKAYALYVRKLLNDPAPADARALIADVTVERLPLEANGWLLFVLAGDNASEKEQQAIRRHLANRATQTAQTAEFASDYTDGSHLILHSNRRTDAVILEALIVDQPKNDLIPKLVAGLLAHRQKGRWGNTQENAFVLLALDRYFNTYEKTTPDFVARAWLGEQFALEQKFVGRSTDQHSLEIPLANVGAPASQVPLVIGKEGAGRLYYRLGLRYAPADLNLPAADYGFTVERSYQGVDDPADVRRDEQGVWHVRAGAKVRVTLTMVAPSRRYHVALVDPLPAGFEAQNPALAVSGANPPSAEPQSRSFWWGPWFEHQNLRDDRAEAFCSLLWGGVYVYRYECLATTPGTFVVPPTKAEEMYAPETFGRAATDRVVIE